MTPSRPFNFLTSRAGIIAAAVVGFTVGAAGLVAARNDDSPARLESAVTAEVDGESPSTSTSSTVDDDADATSTTVDDDDGATSTSTTVGDDDGATSTSTTVARGLPDPFSTTYTSAGGSISVTWSGTAFALTAVAPAAGFHAEIEDQAWDRVRVDFEGDDDDHRIEVRINDGQLRVRVD